MNSNLWSRYVYQQCLNTVIFFMAVTFGAFFTFNAVAGEIVFYEQANFGGQQMNMRTMTSNFDAIGFNDRANSLLVRSGTWLVCTDSDFRGSCATFGRGEYRSLDSRYAGSISSAREVEVYGAPTAVAGNTLRPVVEFFEYAEFGGQSLVLERDVDNFDALRFNDRASSMIVRAGIWEMCTDAGYRGSCRRFGPGRYADLGADLAREISSARLVADSNGAVVNPEPVPLNGSITLYDTEAFLGRGLTLTSEQANLDNLGFNDAAQSMHIERGNWELCTNANYRGNCRVFGPGHYRRLEADFSRTISSLRLTNAAPLANNNNYDGRSIGGRNTGDGGELVLFANNNFTGASLNNRSNIENLALRDFNDRAVALIVIAGRWELCTDANYAGRCVAFTPGRYDNLQDLAKKVSSLRRVN